MVLDHVNPEVIGALIEVWQNRYGSPLSTNAAWIFCCEMAVYPDDITIRALKYIGDSRERLCLANCLEAASEIYVKGEAV